MINSKIGLPLGLLAAVLLAAACGSAHTEAAAGDAARGRNLWSKSPCVACHGADALGTRSGPALADTPLTLRDVTAITRRGGPGMPGYGADQVSDTDLQDIYAWFQNPTAAPAVTAASGQGAWAQSPCAGCHGANGEGGIGPGLAGTALAFAQFQEVVRGGRGSMPAFSAAQVDDAALQALYASLQAQGASPTQEQNPWVQAGCGGCHGASAEGGSAEGLRGEDFDLEKFEREVRRGEDGMPAYSVSQLSDADLRRLYDWLMALP